MAMKLMKGNHALAEAAVRAGCRFFGGYPITPQTTVVEALASMVEDGSLSAEYLHVESEHTALAAAIGAGIFTPVVLQMVAVGEESGAVDDMMNEIGDMYRQEVEYELKTLSQQIEPILIVLLGVMVLILALGIFLPMWDLGKVALKR